MGKAALILLAGTLTMFFAEVCSGASVMWFVTGWAWLLTFWLYLSHFVLLINLALRFKRTSLTSLYLWGVLFGLYESWITKVAWAGYIGGQPILGTVLGFAVCGCTSALCRLTAPIVPDSKTRLRLGFCLSRGLPWAGVNQPSIAKRLLGPL